MTKCIEKGYKRDPSGGNFFQSLHSLSNWEALRSFWRKSNTFWLKRFSLPCLQSVNNTKHLSHCTPTGKVQNAVSAKCCYFQEKHAPNGATHSILHNEGHLCVSGTQEGLSMDPFIRKAVGGIRPWMGGLSHVSTRGPGRSVLMAARDRCARWPCWCWICQAGDSPAPLLRNRSVGLHQRNRWIHFQQHLVELVDAGKFRPSISESSRHPTCMANRLSGFEGNDWGKTWALDYFDIDDLLTLTTIHNNNNK